MENQDNNSNQPEAQGAYDPGLREAYRNAGSALSLIPDSVWQEYQEELKQKRTQKESGPTYPPQGMTINLVPKPSKPTKE